MRIALTLLFLLSLKLSAQKPSADNAFFNQILPSNSPVMFAPNVISDEFGNRDMAISPTGDELFYTLQYKSGFVFSTIMYSKKVNGQWTTPEIAPFCGQYNDLEPAFSPDGTKLYFSSARPLSGLGQKDFDIWFVTKENGVWGNPKNMGSPINTEKDEFYVSVTKSGNIYFTREMEGKGEDIVVCKWTNNQYDTAVSLPDAINSTGGEFNAFVDPDEQFILFTGYKRMGNIGSGDLFISFKNKSGIWEAAKNLGDKINSAGLTYCPYVSPDKKYLFFSTSRGIFKTPFDKKVNFKDLKSLMQNPLNGWDNIYWMATKDILKDAP